MKLHWWLPRQITLKINSRMIDLSVIRNVHTICHECHDMNLKQKTTGETTHLKHQELNGMHSECCKSSGGYVSMMPFVNVFVDEFHVQKSMYGICPYIDPAVHQDKISEESYPTMIVHVIVHLEKISSVEMTHENRCSDKSSQKRIHERPLHCFGVKFGRELTSRLTLPILRVVLLKYVVSMLQMRRTKVVRTWSEHSVHNTNG